MIMFAGTYTYKNNMMKKTIISLCLLTSVSLYANSPEAPLWKDQIQNTVSKFRALKEKKPLIKRMVRLDKQLLENRLQERKGFDSFSRKIAKRLKKAAKSQFEREAITFDLPLPNGDSVKVSAVESELLSPELAEKHPDIKTWNVVGMENDAITGKVNLSSQGFHAMLSMPDGDTIFIDPDKNSGPNVYQSLSRKGNPNHFKKSFACKVLGAHHVDERDLTLEPQSKQLAQVPALDLKTYRLALAGTAEYTASQGGTKSSAFDSMVTTINRVNQIYERDLGISLQIVTGEQFIYTDAATDPYTNSNASAMVGENINNLANNFGNDNFDIGHVFAQGPIGGLAYVGVACLNGANTPFGFLSGIKAGGATGTTDPQGEVFSIEYVAHEIGHQLGADHTFNSTQSGCGGSNRSAATAVEPGSGSTIMSYSGLCGSDDLQIHSEAMFHAASITQINDYTRNDIGATCGIDTPSGNQIPEVDAGLDIHIPANTPFILDGTVTGGVSFAWDQIDTGSASAVDVDTGNNAIIRTYLPSPQQDRFIPKLENLFNQTTTVGELLPQTNRELNFAYVARDDLGGIGIDSKKVDVTDTASTFSVVSQSTGSIFQTNQNIEVLWNVASTNVPPISCSNVDIKLLRENGQMNMLLASTENDGYVNLNIPATTPNMSGARLMIVCSDNSFFNISQGNITIEEGVADTEAPVITLNGVNPINISQGEVYIDAGATAQDNFDNNIVVYSTSDVDTTRLGSYTVSYTATDLSGNSSSTTRTVNIVAPSTDVTAPIITLNGASTINIDLGTTFDDPGATASDDTDGNVDVSVSGSVDENTEGTYTITYSAVDNAGNMSSVIRTIIVNSTVNQSSTGGGGGSTGLLFLPLMVLALRRYLKITV